jgi:hypothetical protein
MERKKCDEEANKTQIKEFEKKCFIVVKSEFESFEACQVVTDFSPSTLFFSLLYHFFSSQHHRHRHGTYGQIYAKRSLTADAW